MRVYAVVDDPTAPIAAVIPLARRAEKVGCDGLLVPESAHDGFLAALLALEHTHRLEVVTAVTVAFPRSPTVTAYAAWDLHAFSRGRFRLGLGSQIRRNIEERYATAWAPPVERMREYVEAVRALWRCWQEGTEVRFLGRHYRITRMQPFFRPPPVDAPPPAIWLGGVRPRMTELAGELADVFLPHPTNSDPVSLRESTLPALERGARRAGRPRPLVIANAFVATGPDIEAVRGERERLRGYLGFLYSTPAYAGALERLGRAQLAPRLRDLARSGRWQEMAAEVDDGLLEAIVTSAPYQDVADRLRERYGDCADGIALRLPQDAAWDDGFAAIVASLQSAPTAAR